MSYHQILLNKASDVALDRRYRQMHILLCKHKYSVEKSQWVTSREYTNIYFHGELQKYQHFLVEHVLSRIKV